MRKTRIILALLFLVGITLLFAGIGHNCLGWMARLQFLPSCLALNFAVIAAVLALTLLFGRLYCSVICPLGVFQDCIIWLRRQIGRILRKRHPLKAKPFIKHFSYTKERKIPRYIFLGAAVAAVIGDIQLFIALIDPYSIYGRMVSSVAANAGGSLLPALLICSAVMLVLIALSSWLWGRAYCNNICPVGTVLGAVSRFSLFKIRIDSSKCSACGRCGRGCKSSCIDMDAHSVDYSRCVDCFDCIGRCKEGAITFSARKTASKKEENSNQEADSGRRAFLATGIAVLGSAVAARADGGFAEVLPKETPERTGKLVPPGAKGEDNFYSHCTACQLCVRACPNEVLRPSSDLEHLLQPEMGFENGFCRPECTACSEVCPTGAITRLLEGQKQTISIGTASVDADKCIAARRGRGCGNCAYHCPTGAITMGSAGGREWRPVVSEEICIGCGKCEYLCPVRPLSAITVNPRKVHKS